MKVSVITVCYNVADSLESTILSVVEQEYSNIEYIIIDGGSKDGTVDIIEKYQNKIAYWVSEPDKGIYDAMNKGLEHATGDWIININSGDRLLRIPYDILQKANIYDAVCGMVISENGIITKPMYNWRIKLQNTLPHQALFYKNVHTQVYDLQYKIVADYNYNLGMYLDNKKVLLIDDIISFHSIIGISNSNKSVAESFRVVKKQCGLFFVFLSYINRKFNALKYYLNKIQ